MLPTLKSGEFVLADRTRPPAPGLIVVVDHPQFETLLIKRVASTGSEVSSGQIWLLSDNPDSATDSRTFGSVDASWVVGAVTMVLDRPFFSEPSFR